MITELRLTNFRCFENHTIPLRSTSIIVGANNAGKSTVVEALRLLSVVVNRHGALNFADVPRWAPLPKSHRGVAPSLKGVDFNADSVFHDLGDPPARISALFDTGASVDLYIGPGAAIHAVIIDPDGKPVTTKGQALQVKLPTVNILPQVSSFAREENILNPEYAKRVVNSSWASLHFRNQLNLYPEFFDEFKHLAESTWKGLRILRLEGQGELPGQPLLLMLKDYDFVTEVAWMGHGLQMWLQTMWFLARSKDSSTIILDEPDVYMHADLQRKLIRLIRGRHEQVIVATHSVEIMAEVSADDILIVNRNANSSIFASKIPDVQQVVNNIGSIHNIHLARLWHSRKCLLVEGEDITFLKLVQNILYPRSIEPFDTLPNIQLGGWSGWNYAIGSKMLLRNAFGEDIIAYCIFDSDYHTPEDISHRIKDAQNRGVQIHIWNKKEIENYFLVPETIQRIIAKEIRKGDVLPMVDEVSLKIIEIIDSQKFEIFNALATELFSQDKAKGVAVANEKAQQRIDIAWKSEDGMRAIVSGKAVISELSKWSQQNYGVILSATRILREMRPEEVEPELAQIVTAIEKGRKFSSP